MGKIKSRKLKTKLKKKGKMKEKKKEKKRAKRKAIGKPNKKQKMPKVKVKKKPKKKQKKPSGQLVVLKLGGSVITDKATPKTISAHLPRIASEIKKAEIKKLVIVHGGGSFGHYVAKKYGTQNGIESTRLLSDQLLGFANTQEAMEELNNLVLHQLLEAGIPAFPLQLSSFVVLEGGSIKAFPTITIRKVLKLGLVPVVYGVPALDTKKGFSILSGDEILHFLAKKLKAKKVLLASDVDGVMTADPKKEKARLIKTVTSETFKKIKFSQASDVTGGMLRKVQELLRLSSFGIESEIINATVPGNLLRALRGEKIGTTIK